MSSELQSGFGSTLEGAVNADIPASNGPFEKQAAQAALYEMQTAGVEVINSQQVANEAAAQVDAMEGATEVVKDAARKALDASVRSLERKANASDGRGKFWRFIQSSPLAKDPSIRDRELQRRQLEAGMGYIRETGAVGRALDPKDEGRHREERGKSERRFEKASKPRRLTLREKLYVEASKRVSGAMARHEQFAAAIGSLRDQIETVAGVVNTSLNAGPETVQTNLTQGNEALAQSQQRFAETTTAAQQANYTGYTTTES